MAVAGQWAAADAEANDLLHLALPLIREALDSHTRAGAALCSLLSLVLPMKVDRLS